MSPVYGAVLVASVLGSLHCASMCAPFVALASLRDERHGPVVLQGLYHAGRLLAYSTLGCLAGALGSSLDFGASLLGVGRVAGVLAGVLLIGIGGGRVLTMLGVRMPDGMAARAIGRLVMRAQRLAMKAAPRTRAFATGLCSGLLPCGWLYAFVAVAAGTGSAMQGAAVMGLFWTGTVPILACIGAGVRKVIGRSGRWFQVATAVLVIGLGVASIVGRWNILVPSASAAAVSHGPHRCH